MLARFHRGASALSVAVLLLAGSPARAASWQALSYGGSMKVDYYVPDQPATPPPILVSLHYCGGVGSNARSWFQSYADQYGFIIITPTAGGSCFDAAASRAGERQQIANMVASVIMNKGADKGRIFAAGLSSGACMAHALVAAYPDVFAAGSSLAGVPAGAWTGGNEYGWSTSGATTAQAWGDKVRNADPGYTGSWGRMQIWHGEADTNLTYSQNYPYEVSQWTNVHGVGDADSMNTMTKPPGASNTWNRTSYSKGGVVVVEANHVAGVDHDLGSKNLWADVVRFFELSKSQADTTYGKGGMGGAGGTGGMGSGGMAAGGSAGTGMGMGGSGTGGQAAGGTAGTGMSAGGTGMPAGGMGTGGTGTTTAGTGGTSVSTSGTTGAAGTSTGTGGSTTGTGGTAPSAGRSGSVMGGAGTGAVVTPDSSGASTPTDTGGGCHVGSSRRGTERSALAALGLGLLGLTLRRRRSTARR